MTLHTGDCLDVMPTLDAESVDAVVTDPPYGLGFMGKAWDSFGPSASQGGEYEASAWRPHAPNARSVSGYMRKGQRGLTVEGSAVGNRSQQEWHERWAAEALRVAKPGAYLLAFGGTRTYHRLACAIEDAGWIIRDSLLWGSWLGGWINAQGFPKSRASLKPAWEPIVMARKPGASSPLQIDAARIGTTVDERELITSRSGRSTAGPLGFKPQQDGWKGEAHESGRWPANVLLTATESGRAIFDGDVPGVVGGGEAPGGGEGTRGNYCEPRGWGFRGNGESLGPRDSGTYSRFFLIPKADRAEREPLLPPVGHDRSKRLTSHPTVKPLDLMRHLVRLVTPPGGLVLDPFGGSGTTALACELEGFRWVLIEREPEYVAQAEARLLGTQRGMGLPA